MKTVIMPRILVILFLVVGTGFGGYWFFLRPPALTSGQAVERVKELPEVKKYLLEVPHALVEVDHESPEGWFIHVYEIKEGHTATMNWFTVGKKDGKIGRLFEFEREK